MKRSMGVVVIEEEDEKMESSERLETLSVFLDTWACLKFWFALIFFAKNTYYICF